VVTLTENGFILKMRKISKSFPGVKALDSVDFDLKNGEVHALVGENGAGKSTLMKVLSGFYLKDSGEIYLNGEEVEINNPRIAISLGISTIYQDIMAVPNMSVAENILLGEWPRNRIGIINWRKLENRVKAFLNELSIELDVKENVVDLSTARQQLLEIVKALIANSKIIIMDEPTASLTEDEKNILFRIISDVKSKGVSIIYISHRMEEIFEIADRVTVMRDGKIIETKNIDDTDHDEIANYMIGRKIDEMYAHKSLKISKDIILEIKDFNKEGFYKDINFNLYKGEILGFAGLVGSGRSELMKSIFGIIQKDRGNMLVDGKEVEIKHPKRAMEFGFGFVSEDRKIESLMLNLSVDQNISAANLKDISKLGILVSRLERNIANRFVKKLSIKCYSLKQKVLNLSGGNQQKVIIARWLNLNPKILILDEPTKGIDIGSKAEIHKLIVEIAKNGTSIILISSEMTEVLKISNRIAIMKDGEIKNIINTSEATEEIILRHMTGITNQVNTKGK
jgi:ribose transport system ATP-binding protein